MAINRSTETRLVEVVELDALFEVKFHIESRSAKMNWGGLGSPAEVSVEIGDIRETESGREPTDQEWAYLEPLIEQEIDEMFA